LYFLWYNRFDNILSEQKLEKGNPEVLSRLTGKKIGDVYFADIADIHTFLSSTGDCRDSLVINKYKDVLVKHEDEIVYLMTHEIGKPISQCREEIHESIEYLNAHEYDNVSEDKLESALILGSISNPVFQLTISLCKNLNLYKKIVFKSSSKTATTTTYIFKKLVQDPEILERVLVVSLSKLTLDDLLGKHKFDIIYKYSRGGVYNSGSQIVDYSEKDRVLFFSEEGDVDIASGQIVENIFDFEKFNKSKIQHIFVQNDSFYAFYKRLVFKIENNLKAGKADDPSVNFSDTFKRYKRQDLKELLLEMVSFGADILTGSIGDEINSPILIKFNPSLEKYYKKNIWAPIIFIIPYKDLSELSKLIEPFHELTPIYYINEEGKNAINNIIQK